MSTIPTGILWTGPLYQDGYGTITRNFLLGLHRIGIPVRVKNIGSFWHGHIRPDVVSLLRRLEHTNVGEAPVGVINWTPDMFPKIRFRDVVKTIGCTLFETDRLPRDWRDFCNTMDEIWVPSAFNRETFAQSGIAREKLRVLPYGVDTQFYRPAEPFAYRLPGQRGTTFLATFSLDWRKGFDLLLEAYLNEFTEDDDVSLILKTYRVPHAGIPDEDTHSFLLSSVSNRVDLTRGNLPHWLLLDGSIPEEELRRLVAASDVVVSTERACGWGFPLLEAMAMRKPVVSIAWGGALEFLHPANSLLIPTTGRLIPVDERLARARPLYAGHQWAEVHVDSIRRTLRFAVDHRRDLATRATRAQEEVQERYSVEAAAARVAAALRSLQVTSRPARSIFHRGPGITFDHKERGGRRVLSYQTAKHLLRSLLGERGFWKIRELLIWFSIGGARRPAARGRRPLQTIVRRFGVNIVGHLTAASGVGEAVRATVRAAASADIPHTTYSLESFFFRRDRSFFPANQNGEPYRINLMQVNADQFPLLPTLLGKEFFTNSITIGIWAWELSAFPARWHDRFSLVDEIWTYSTFCAAALAPVSPVPVVRIMPAVDVPPSTITMLNGKIRRNPCTFLFVYDYCSMAERKNPLAVVETFRKAFSSHEPVRLILKCINPKMNIAYHRRLVKAAAGISCEIIDQPFSQQEMESLLALCDVYVSLHRSEGFGLTLARAMAFGKPVIATGYSGNTDFMTPENSFPVRYQLTDLPRTIGPYPRGAIWAEPDTEDAARLFRTVYEHPEEASMVGARAAAHIRSLLSPRAVGIRMRDRLTKILTVPARSPERKKTPETHTAPQALRRTSPMSPPGLNVRSDAPSQNPLSVTVPEAHHPQRSSQGPD